MAEVIRWLDEILRQANLFAATNTIKYMKK
jgi:hypothetical protein